VKAACRQTGLWQKKIIEVALRRIKPKEIKNSDSFGFYREIEYKYLIKIIFSISFFRILVVN
jgi:hypothetical protein